MNGIDFAGSAGPGGRGYVQLSEYGTADGSQPESLEQKYLRLQSETKVIPCPIIWTICTVGESHSDRGTTQPSHLPCTV